MTITAFIIMGAVGLSGGIIAKLPSARIKTMARKPVEPNTDRTKLLAALRFASLPAEKEGASTYVTIMDRYAIGQNDTYSVGTPIAIDLRICPQTTLFEAALKACTDAFDLSQISPTEIVIGSGRFKAVVPAVPHSDANWVTPDKLCGMLPELPWRQMAAIPEPKKNDKVHNHSLLLRQNSLVATNGGLLVEHWHGTDLPRSFAVPLLSAAALGKFPARLCGFGYSPHSFTFWFEDGSFLKTRLMSEPYPALERIFSTAAKPENSVPLWTDFYKAMSAIDKFVVDDTIHFQDGTLCAGERASYEVPGLPGGHKFSAAYWWRLEELIDRVALGSGVPALFLGPSTRAVMAGRV